MACKHQIAKVLESAKRPMALHEIQLSDISEFRLYWSRKDNKRTASDWDLAYLRCVQNNHQHRQRTKRAAP